MTTTARFRVNFAGPLVSFQDGGRQGQLRYGVPASGPMDQFAHKAANAALLMDDASTAIEISPGGLVLECLDGEVTAALAGGAFDVAIGDQRFSGWAAHTIKQGQKITVRAGKAGSWCYLAFAGKIQTETWLGSAATHLLSGLGGGALQTGDEFTVSHAQILPSRTGDIPHPDLKPQSTLRVVIGPQDGHFDAGTIQTLLSQTFQLSNAFDRMGVRLNGPPLPIIDALSIPSEPVLKGSIQVSGDGVPTILLADHQTTGGYPKIATVIAPDIDKLVQLRASTSVSFEAITAERGVQIARQTATTNAGLLDTIRAPRLSLEERLMRENLISGVITD